MRSTLLVTNRFMTILLSFSVVMISMVMLVGCGGERKPRYKIGVSQCSGDSWREQINLDLQMELLNHPDVELDIRNADNDSKRQQEDVRYFINNNYDLIILAPNESTPLAGVVDEAAKKGIPVVTFDRMTDSDRFTAHMEVDNYKLGKGVTDYLISYGKGPWKILEIRGPESASPAQLRHDGFTDGVKGNAEMEVVASVFGEWDNGRAEWLTDSVMRVHPEINMVFAHTDHMGLGAYEALKKIGREDVVIIGIDGFPDQGIKYVSEGKLTATFLYPTEGQRLLKIALAILNGEPYERINRVAPLSPVDSSNADILLSQDTLLRSGTSKVLMLNEKIDQELKRYSTQKMLLWAFVAIVVLLSGFVFVLLRSINVRRQHQKELEEKQIQLENNQRELKESNRQLQEEKEKQEALYSQLSEATRSKLTFFTNVSHDLRTPLTLIAGPVENVDTEPGLSERGRALMELTKKNVGILRRLIDQILDFRKYENGKSELRLSEADFGQLLKDWTDSFREVARKRHIRLHIKEEGKDIKHETKGANYPSDDVRSKEISGTTECAVDVEKMERVFFNLMSNAFKHTPDNGSICVEFRCSTSQMSYTVRDSGCGIDRSEIEKIFDRFYQAEGANPKGSGIGLALTKAFVELHGGAISVESEKGEGSAFTVTFPVRHTEKRASIQSHITHEDVELELSPVAVDVKREGDERPTLLVIDDNADIRTLISGQMADEYNVLTASDGLQGLRMATKYVPDIIICDVMMPVMDGLESVKAIKEEVSTSHIPVLMLTACTQDEQRIAGYEHGADAYLSKPFNLGVLTARCRNLLANRRLIRELYQSWSFKGGVTEKQGASYKMGKDGDSVVTEDTAKHNRLRQPSYRPNDVESEFYSRFVEIVENRISDPDIQVSEIASAMGLGQSQFTRKIKAITNYTPVELVRNMRLHRAKTMLLNSEKNVGEIAYAVGFSSLAYFSKCYKDTFGVSPKETREGNRN